MTEVLDDSPETDRNGVSRRNVLRAGAVGVAAVGLGAGKVLLEPSLRARGLANPDGVFSAASIALADSIYIEAFPTSPLILNPFSDPLVIPPAAKPVPASEYTNWPKPPGPGIGQQNSFGNEAHQLWPSAIGFPDPIVYKFDLLVRTHSFSTSRVLPINALGQNVASYDAAGNVYPAGTVRTLPPSTIYGFNGTFPGPRINAEYGKPVLVRFENHLDESSPSWTTCT
jgi:FtsP/CotA-like multicopper oxidase with cupredoxin domain